MKENEHISHENKEVEHWMNRALRAERKLDEERQETIKSNPEIYASYKKTLGVLSGKGKLA